MYRLGELLENCPVKKDLEVVVKNLMKNLAEASSTCNLEGQMNSGLYQIRFGQQHEGGWKDASPYSALIKLQ